jgi:hypothetical protein
LQSCVPSEHQSLHSLYRLLQAALAAERP